jgi:hypothetical protein
LLCLTHLCRSSLQLVSPTPVTTAAHARALSPRPTTVATARCLLSRPAGPRAPLVLCSCYGTFTTLCPVSSTTSSANPRSPSITDENRTPSSSLSLLLSLLF